MLIINLIGLGLIALIVWWFWLYKPQSTQVSDEHNISEITVVIEDGIYQPANISLLENKTLNIKFIRKDESPCAATVLFPDLEISADLPLNKEFSVQLPAMKKGEYAFHCQMKMYNGSVVVK
ncbi:cupredoxin domain-containing protein [Colwellia hornerae]|uniref:Cupredoxin domain-containing protein n=1 Tax=Colwellia hornerae TaxID=89402 RepID=A0A5C6QNF7_9GAMM|nr:cupredoxin domain-containing protein [Colwellia hornerae]TWX54644.1 cupredoxin domain-containing protein [Colwellia hornerae]TWX61084.1 cupredoxin domain-containing protein [Colwellia hornerae]TWX70337.1 cupredoxin domain-containing protein [Colwellia hornerae]